jgi:hypothetical protein
LAGDFDSELIHRRFVERNLHTSFRPLTGQQPIGDAILSGRAEGNVPSSIVKDGRLPRTTDKHGQSPLEVRRISEATHALERFGSSIFVTIESKPDESEAVVRDLGDKVKNHIRMFQRRQDCPAYCVEVLEPRPRLHVHLVAASPRGHLRRLVASLRTSTIFGDRVKVRPVYDMPGLARYLCKFATPQAHYAAGRAFRRVPGSHRMEGDRVRLSRELERDLIVAGAIRPFARTYAKRLPKAAAFLAEIEVQYHVDLFDGSLPAFDAPPKPKATPRRREKIAPPTLPMLYPPTIADMLAGLGETHEAVAARVGLSRPQVTNIIVGRFGASRPIARRVLERARAA